MFQKVESMKTLRIVIECENASFFDNGLTDEVQECLKQVVSGMEQAQKYKNIKDSNGNIAGQFRFTDEE
jgi:hypothetical protein